MPNPYRFNTLPVSLLAALLLVQGAALYGALGASVLAYLFGASFLLFLFLPHKPLRVAVGSVAAFFVATLLLWGGVVVSGMDSRLTPAPDVLLSAYDMTLGTMTYEKNAVLDIPQPGGDLALFSTVQGMPHAPRKVLFATNAAGHRNDTPLSPGDALLIGDSFVSGSGNSQGDTLAALLRTEQGISAYSIGAPGNLFDYVTRVQRYGAGHTGKVYVFVFEGDDFLPYAENLRPLLYRYAQSLRTSALAQTLHALRERATGGPAVTLAELDPGAGRGVLAFSSAYMERTRQTADEAGPMLAPLVASLKGAVDGIFFIPTKYRVYAPLLKSQAEPLPHVHWQALQAACAQAEIPVYDLTPALRDAAANEWFTHGELVWWSDDTHWNRNGIAAAAREVARVMTTGTGSE